MNRDYEECLVMSNNGDFGYIPDELREAILDYLKNRFKKYLGESDETNTEK